MHDSTDVRCESTAWHSGPTTLLVLCLVVSLGCGGQDASQTAAKCAESDLVAQCPPGTTPELNAAAATQCSGSGEANLIEQSGAVTGSCEGVGECRVLCNFSTPCFCGVDRITSDGVFCVQPCAKESACGNGQCEPGENPLICPIDCGSRCEENASRCNGNEREVCSATGVYERVSCPPETTCTDSGQSGAVCIARCTPETSRCNGNQREVCDEFGRYEGLECPPQTLCQEVSNDESQCVASADVSDAEPNPMTADAGLPPPSVDAAIPDAGRMDMQIVDAFTADATVVDAMIPDMQIIDAMVPDMQIVDAIVPLLESSFSASVDTFLQSTQDFGMNGREELVIGNGPGIEQYIALIRFELGALDNAVIERANLCLTPADRQLRDVELSWRIGRIENDWGAGIGWPMRNALGVPDDVVDTQFFVRDEVCLDVSPIVQSWADMSPNNGFIIEGQPGNQAIGVFKSSEAAGNGAPTLIVQYRN